MKHILFFIESLSGGGAEKVLVTLLKYLDYSKYQVTLLTLVDTGVLKNEIDFSKITYRTAIKQTNNPILKAWYKVKYKLLYHYLPAKWVNQWIIPQKGIDIYIAFTEGYCTKILAHTPKKKMAWVHIDLKALPWTLNEGIYKNIQEEKRTYSKYDKVVCVSQSVQQIMEQEYGLKNTITIYNPIDKENIIKRSEETSTLSVSSGFNIISVGRLVHQKGYDILIPIVSRLIKSGLDMHLCLLGEGAEKEKLKHIIQEEGIEKNVHLFGFQTNPYAIMKNMDLFVCSSRSEGYSLVIAEALTLGLPVISMNCSGPNELLDNNKYGILCNSYEELYQAIKRAATDSLHLKELQEKASSRKDFFDIASTVKQMENLFSES